MKLRNNKGITGVDISIALIIIVLFVSIVSTLVYNFIIASRSVNRKSEATNIAISKIEELKSDYATRFESDNIQELQENDGEVIQKYNSDGVITVDGPYTVTTKITKYSDSEYAPSNAQELQDVIKIVTVTVEYSVGNKNKNIEIKSAITKED